MSYKFTIPTCPFSDKERLYKRSSITIQPGLTVLVGCNGAGKTTLQMFMKEQLRKEEVPYRAFDNLRDGKSNVMQESLMRGQTDIAAQAFMSSEGEGINLAFGVFVSKVGTFVRSHKGTDKIFVFCDAIDSGLSIDNIVEVRDFFEFLMEQEKNIEFYFVVSANSYEMARNAECFDVQKGTYVRFSDYEQYRKFILNSRTPKNKRYTEES